MIDGRVPFARNWITFAFLNSSFKIKRLELICKKIYEKKNKRTSPIITGGKHFLIDSRLEDCPGYSKSLTRTSTWISLVHRMIRFSKFVFQVGSKIRQLVPIFVWLSPAVDLNGSNIFKRFAKKDVFSERCNLITSFCCSKRDFNGMQRIQQ